MKTWHKFWQNPFWIKIICGAWLITGSVASEQLPPSLFTSLETLDQIDKKRMDTVLEDLNKEKRYLTDIMEQEAINLEQSFLVSLLHNTPASYISLMANNFCTFYDLMAAGLLRDARGELQNLVVRVSKNDKITEMTQVSKESYLEYVWSRECEQGKAANQLFQTAQLPSTLKSIELPYPQNHPQCLADLEKLSTDIKTPYLCGLLLDIEKGKQAEKDLIQLKKDDPLRKELKRKIIRAEIIQTLIKNDKREILGQVCSNLHESQGFCDIFLKTTIWDQITKSNALSEKYCDSITDAKKLKTCLTNLKKDHSLCHFPKNAIGTLLPAPGCQTISQIHLASQLSTEHQDCPGNLGNEAVVNLSRIISNFNKMNDTPKDCEASLLQPWWQMMDLADSENAWPMSVCYQRKASNEKECLKIFFNRHMGKNSLVEVFERILKDNRKIDQGAKCEFISDQKYNPSLLEFKVGCYLVFQNDQCSTTECDFKVILNTVEYTNFELIKEHQLQYFPVINSKRNYAQTVLLEKGLRKQSKPLENLSSIRFFLKQYEKVSIHGIGCAEFLLPSIYKMKALSQCRPLPFTIIGVTGEESLPALIVQLSNEDNLSARIIPWKSMLQAIKTYQKLHPLNEWSLHALF